MATASASREMYVSVLRSMYSKKSSTLYVAAACGAVTTDTVQL